LIDFLSSLHLINLWLLTSSLGYIDNNLLLFIIVSIFVIVSILVSVGGNVSVIFSLVAGLGVVGGVAGSLSSVSDGVLVVGTIVGLVKLLNVTRVGRVVFDRVVNVIHIVIIIGIIGIILHLFLSLYKEKISLSSHNIFEFLNTFSSYTVFEQSKVIVLFFVLFPLLNALLDWLSISVTRYEFAKLINNSKTYFSYVSIIIWDLLLAFGFKLLVLFLLYINAHIWEGNPAVFEVGVMKEYWRYLLSLYLFQEVDMAYFYSTQSIQLISLMIMTTLVPSIVHIVIIVIHLFYKIFSQILGLLSYLFIGNARFFSFVMSFISVGILWFIVSSSFNSPEFKSMKELNVTKK